MRRPPRAPRANFTKTYTRYGHHPFNHPDSSVNWRFAYVAVQLRLGILSHRRYWSFGRYYPGFGFAGPDLAQKLTSQSACEFFALLRFCDRCRLAILVVEPALIRERDRSPPLLPPNFRRLHNLSCGEKNLFDSRHLVLFRQ